MLGIDPGKTGALALLDTDTGALVAVTDMPTADKVVDHVLLAATVRQLAPVDVAAVELVGSRPGEAPSFAFRFGRSYGIILGVMAGVNVPVELVHPARWKRDLRLSGDKSASRSMASARWPDDAPLFRRIKDDGRAEAALLAFWLHHHSGRLVLPAVRSSVPW